MRTEITWKSKVFPKVLKELTPRIQRDLLTLNEIIPPIEIDSFYLWGKVGSGKTIFAASLYLEEKKRNYLLSADIDAVFISVPEFFQEIKKSYQDDISEEEILTKFYETDLLVLDDLGVEKSSEWAWNLLYLLINKRYENLKKTIITSNLSLKALAEKLNDDRIPSRISRMCKIMEFKKSYTND